MPIRAGSTPVTLKSGRRSGFKVGGQGAAAVAAPFDPTTIAGMVAWYDFSDGGVSGSLFTDTARTTPVTADADTIGGVTDKSGTGNHLAQATAGARPVYVTNVKNSRAVSRYLAANSTRVAGTFGAAVAQPCTIFCVTSVTTGPPGGNYMSILEGSNTNTNHQVFALQGTSTLFVLSSPTLLTGGAWSTATWYIAACYFNGASSKFYINGGTASGSGAAGANNLEGMTIGTLQGGTSQKYTGDIGEVFAYNTALSIADLNTVGAGLASKWGITWSTAS